MTLEEVKRVLKAEVLVGNNSLHREVMFGCGSDLMSDVLAFLKPNALLLTGLTNPQSVRTAEMADVVAVCYVRGKQPNPETVKLAEEKQIPILVTRYTMFESCGLLYGQGLPGSI